MITKNFLLAGDAIFTIQEPDGTHHTFRLEKVEANDRWPESYFCKVLTGPDNTSDYTYFGKLDRFTGQVVTTAKSAKWKGTRKEAVLNRVLARIWCDDHDAYTRHGWSVHHEGRCGRCGRLLTVPESVESGIGPECAKRMACVKA